MKINLLRTTVFSFIFIFCSLNSRSQWVSIPDTGFGGWLSTHGYDMCLQGNSIVGWQMDTTCPQVINGTDVYPQHKNVKDVTGIEYFDNLQYFVCSFNQITSIPTLPDNVILFDCSDNRLTSLPPLPNG